MRIILGAVLFVLLAAPAHASGPQPLTIYRDWTQHQDPVEQESPNFFDNNCGFNPANPACDPSTWVTNPTDCTWDVDDSTADMGFGYLTGTVTDSLCVVADEYDNFGGDDKRIEARVYAPANTLTVTFQGQSVIPVVSGSGFEWLACVHEHETVFGPIPVSNGGTGRILTFDLMVSAARKTNGVAVRFQTWGNYPYVATHCA